MYISMHTSKIVTKPKFHSQKEVIHLLRAAMDVSICLLLQNDITNTSALHRLFSTMISLLSLLLLFSSCLLTVSSTDSDQNVCINTNNWEYAARYHSDDTCDRAGFNVFKNSIQRHLTHRRLSKNGNHATVPTQQTVQCPQVVKSLYNVGDSIGYDTTWIMENTASTPVVIAFVHPQTALEVSPFNTAVAAWDDPAAIVMPGKFKAGKLQMRRKQC